MTTKFRLIILTPIYNDWESYAILQKKVLEKLESKPNYTTHFLAIDDFSDKDHLDLLPNQTNTTILSLIRNLGHQRAIAIGLAYIKNEINEVDAVIVIDGDGQDKPDDILLFLDCFEKQTFPQIIFAKRSKRTENLFFRLFYIFYKNIFKALTGHKISFGNFSLIPYNSLQRIVYLPEIWNNYPSAVVKSKSSYTTIKTNRGYRYKGKSKMNFISLILHGLNSISVYIDIVVVRLSLFFIFLMAISVIGIVCVVSVKLFTKFAIPGWATNVTMGFLMIIGQAVLGLLLLTLLILSNRKSKDSIPNNDYLLYLKR